MMAATNRPDILDPALLRPGRFDRQVVVPLPESEERSAILTVHAKDKSIDENIDLDLVAKGTPGMSGADLANLVNEAALNAVRMDRDSITQEDFEAARDRILIGQRRDSVAMTDREKEVTAYHEGGHALIATLFANSDPVHKVTILPTGQALGITTSRLLPGLHRRSLGGFIRRPHGRRHRIRCHINRRCKRSDSRNRASTQNGNRMGNERPRRAYGLGIRQSGIPR